MLVAKLKLQKKEAGVYAPDSFDKLPEMISTSKVYTQLVEEEGEIKEKKLGMVRPAVRVPRSARAGQAPAVAPPVLGPLRPHGALCDLALAVPDATPHQGKLTNFHLSISLQLWSGSSWLLCRLRSLLSRLINR